MRKKKLKMPKAVAKPFTPKAKLKRKIRRHFTSLGFVRANDGTLVLPGKGKKVIRNLHSAQRAERLAASLGFLQETLPSMIGHFANGSEIEPANIRLGLKLIEAGTEEGDLFRIATMTWSVPVSQGFGRRLRYLVWDEHHDRLAGVIALGDPVFNLSVRDDLVGWTSRDRSKRLVNVLDAYVLGAVPPYNMLLGGKAVACLIKSKEIYDDFAAAYGGSVGIISGKSKRANLLAVTTSSSMGRSSVYNRLKLDGKSYFESIGYTIGWGHFHITDHIFGEIRDYLRLIKHEYADRHRFGQGPNWRLRTIRAALGELGINQAVLRHGIKREVFMCLLAGNAVEILKSGKGMPDTTSLLTVAEISEIAKNRWIIPRAERRPEFRAWSRKNVIRLIKGSAPNLSMPRVKAG